MLFRWSLLPEIRQLGPSEGLNAIVKPGRRVQTIELDAPGILVDVDTPDDYKRWQP